MRFSFWLTNLSLRLASTKTRNRRTRKHRPGSWLPALVENIEPRRMLSAAPAAIGLETAVSPHLSDYASKASTGKFVQSAVATDPNGDYVVAWSNEFGGNEGIFAQRY